MAKWKRLGAAAAAAFLMIAPSALAGDGPADGLTLRQCIDISLARNPLWLSAEEDYRASLARVRQAREAPQPSLDYDSDLQPRLFDFGGSGEAYFGVSQTLEFPGRRSLRGKIAASESREVLADKDLLRLDVVFRVKEAFYAVLRAGERRKYAAQDLGLARDFLAKAEAKFEAGDAAKLEVVRAGVEASKAATALKLAENDVLLAKARLNYLLGRAKFEPLEVQGGLVRAPVPIDREALVERALRSRPEVARIRAGLEKESRRKSDAALSYLPDFALSLSRHRLAGEATTWDFRLSFPVPLFFWQPARGRIAEARANIRSLERRSKDLANRIGLEVGEACFNARTAAERIVLFEKEILAQAEDVYELVLFSFQEGEASGIELIEARRSLLEARRAYADALYDHSLTIAVLERSVGGPLEGVPHE
ncbi:MAG TPA: TolC family protein [Candidatus Aminicenantes bacterium]|nr:TolC family protein [Candidatus Aminicenantes bacterium]